MFFSRFLEGGCYGKGRGGQVAFPIFSVVAMKHSNGGLSGGTVFSLLRTKPESKSLTAYVPGFPIALWALLFKAMP